MTLKIRLTEVDRRPQLAGFRYFWLKRVTGFNPSVHCAGCLKGEYVKAVGLTLPAGADIPVPATAGDLFYLCGVASPYRWENNAHIALRARKDATATLTLYTGATVTITGAERVPFTDEAALQHYPGKGRAFLTCRNYQFGAALHHGRLA